MIYNCEPRVEFIFPGRERYVCIKVAHDFFVLRVCPKRELGGRSLSTSKYMYICMYMRRPRDLETLQAASFLGEKNQVVTRPILRRRCTCTYISICRRENCRHARALPRSTAKRKKRSESVDTAARLLEFIHPARFTDLQRPHSGGTT